MCVCVCVCVCVQAQITFQSLKVSVVSSFAYISRLFVSLEDISITVKPPQFPDVLWEILYYCSGLTKFKALCVKHWVQKQTNLLSFIFLANYLSVSSLAAIQHERMKDPGADRQSEYAQRTEEGTPGAGFDPDRASGRPSKPTSFIFIKRIHQNLTKKSEWKRKYDVPTDIEEG